MSNIFAEIPQALRAELFDSLLDTGGIRIERILSKGHSSPEVGWYDQDQDEWVLVLEGAGRIVFEDGADVLMERGDYLHIPAHRRHRVTWTDPVRTTVWLALFFPGDAPQA